MIMTGFWINGRTNNESVGNNLAPYRAYRPMGCENDKAATL